MNEYWNAEVVPDHRVKIGIMLVVCFPSKWNSLSKYQPACLTSVLGKIVEHQIGNLINKELRVAYLMSSNMVYGQRICQIKKRSMFYNTVAR